MFVVDKVTTLCLNKSWIPIGTKTAGEAISSLFSGNYLAVHVEEQDGAPNFFAYNLDEWLTLPTKNNELYINSIKLKVKVPVVVVAKNFNQIPLIETKLSHQRISERDNYTCQYTGKKFSREEARINGSVDHVVPKSRGGKESWENLVFCDKNINLTKSNKTPEEAGLKLLKKPSSVAFKIPISLTIKNKNNKCWDYFII